MIMRRLMAFTTLLLTGFLILMAQTNEVRANGTETLGNLTGLQPGTGIVSGGTGLVFQPGIINVNVPFGATVKQVLLYWEGVSNSVNGTNCTGAVQDTSITVEGNNVTGAKIGGPTFVLITPLPRGCFSSYRADITSLGLVEEGANSLEVSGLNFTRENMGAGIIVIFDQGVATVEFSGEATVLDAFVNLLLLQVDVTEVEAGPLPPEGGSFSDSVNELDVANLLTSDTATASTTGGGNQVFSFAEVEGLGLNILNLLTLGASVIRAEAEATCDSTGDAIVTGDSEILDLTTNLLGDIPVAFPANTPLVNLPVLGLGQVVIVANEQVTDMSPDGSFAEITVNALHITITALGVTVVDIVISSAHADIECETVDPDRIPIKIKDGHDYAFKNFAAPLNTTKQQAFTFSAATFPRTANITLFIADCDADRPDTIRIRTLNGTTVITDDKLIDRCVSNAGFRFDALTIPVEIPAGANKVTVQILSQKTAGSKLGSNKPDSLAWILAALSGPTGDGITFSGRGTVARASVLGIASFVLGDTGPLPPSGGVFEEPGVDLTLPPIVTSGTGSAKTMGAGTMSSSEAIVEDLEVVNVLNAISASADVLQAMATAECDQNGNASVAGASVFVDAVLNIVGLPQINIPLNPAANTVLLNQNVPLVGLVRIVVNEQIVEDTNGIAEITVNALHITVGQGGVLSDIADVVIASAHADISCN